MTTYPPTIGQLFDFVMEHKADKVFKEYTPEQIVTLLNEGLKDNSLYYALDKTGLNITGMILAEVSVPSKTIFVSENLAMSLDNLAAFAKKATEQYKGFRFLGFKHNKERNYTKTFNKLTKD